MAECSIAVFDLGGVLIDWYLWYLFRSLFDDDTEAMGSFSLRSVRNAGTNNKTLVVPLPMPVLH